MSDPDPGADLNPDYSGAPGRPWFFDDLPGHRVHIGFRGRRYGHEPVYSLGAAAVVCFGCGRVAIETQGLAHHPCDCAGGVTGVDGGPHDGDHVPTAVPWSDPRHPDHADPSPALDLGPDADADVDADDVATDGGDV